MASETSSSSSSSSSASSSVEFLRVCRSLQSWPVGEGAIQSLAQRIGGFLKVPLVALYSDLDQQGLTPERDQRHERIGVWKQSGEYGMPRESFEDLLGKRIRAMGASEPVVLESGGLGGVGTFTLIPISCTFRPEDAEVVAKKTGEAGWLLVGSDKPLATEADLMAVAIAQRLGELSEIDRLQRSIQARSQFLSIASHELKTPLTSIYGILQLQDRMSRLKKDVKGAAPVGDEAKRSYLKILLRQVERLNELIDGLLDVSRIQNGRFLVDPSEADVAQLVRDTVQGRLSIVAQDAGVKLHLESPETLTGWVDPVRLEEVVTNLVMNAIRFSPEGGVVWIRLQQADGTIRLSIRDQGPSVPPEDRERIFQPFERAQRTSRLGGMGLGLFISRQIAILHGGSVSLIESVPGKGNLFEAVFPAHPVRAISA